MSGNIVPGQKRPLSLRDGRATPAFGFGNGADSLLCLPNTALNGGFELEARLASSPSEAVPAGTAGGPLRREVLVPRQQKKTLHSLKIGSLLPTGVWGGVEAGEKPTEGKAGSSIPAELEGRDRVLCPQGHLCRPQCPCVGHPSTAPQSPCHIPVSHPHMEQKLSLCPRTEAREHPPEPTAL